MKVESFLKITAISVTVATLAACTNAQTHVGSVSTYYEGTITSLELLDNVDSRKYNSTGNGVIGALGGALIGGLIGDNSSSVLLGASLGGIAGAGGSSLANRGEGVRMTVNTRNGPTIVDTHFNCRLKLGSKVRLLSGSRNGDVQVYANGAYRNLTPQTEADCPSNYAKIKRGLSKKD